MLRRWLAEQRHLDLLSVLLSVTLWAESAALTEVPEPTASALLPTRLNRALIDLCAALATQPNPDLLRCARPSTPPPRVDEDVQFTVYKPKTLFPGRWDKFLAFAHLGRNPTDAPPGTPSPEQRVREQAAALLGPELGHFDQRVEDSASAVPREGRLTFLPAFDGLDFEPPYCTFVWLGEIHRAEFQVRAMPERAGQTLRGKLRVLCGGLLLAELNLSISVGAAGEPWSVETLEHGGSARAYRKIFASYSHDDRHIVEQVSAYAAATGDRYLVDHVELRSGEKWSQALERMIGEADIFQLFWSTRSMQSAFVRREWEYALSLRRPEFVRPTYWETPFPEAQDLPPAPLKELHFACIALPKRTLPAPVGSAPLDPLGMLGSLAGLATASAALLLTLRTGSLNEETSAAERLTRAATKVLEGRKPVAETGTAHEISAPPSDLPATGVQGVPELNAQGASTALFLVFGAWAIWSGRRRRPPSPLA
ncbi:MAG TPA: TIR domain-containing protein [Polyangiaceae bacterium]|nr:TIR domain-containing protein [Polyangiaceae bacterium]